MFFCLCCKRTVYVTGTTLQRTGSFQAAIAPPKPFRMLVIATIGPVKLNVWPLRTAGPSLSGNIGLWQTSGLPDAPRTAADSSGEQREKQ